MEKRLASFKPVDLAVLEFRQNKRETMRRLQAAGREAIEQDGAEAIILGCTATYGFGQELQSELGVPVIDPIIASLKHAEFLSEVGGRYDWRQTKIGAYESPSEAEMAGWKLSE
jgi:allantoin racemase